MQNKFLTLVIILVSASILLAGCSRVDPMQIDQHPPKVLPVDDPENTAIEPTRTTDAPPASFSDLTSEQISTLAGLERINDFPLYRMHYIGSYHPAVANLSPPVNSQSYPYLPESTNWACSLFASLNVNQDMYYGRNFDWRYSPAVLLFSDPPDGYASVSMVDIAYLFEEEIAVKLTELPIEEREPLLQSPFWPFDGMNEHGLVIGMAAVSSSVMPYDPEKETIDSLMIMRLILDHARNVEEALKIIEGYNIDWVSGPALHYLIADPSGRAVLVEFVDGDMRLLTNKAPWHLATNFLRTTPDQDNSGSCWRFEIIQDRMVATGGGMTKEDGLKLLEEVSWEGAANATQWSVLYNMSQKAVHVVMGREFDHVFGFELEQ